MLGVSVGIVPVLEDGSGFCMKMVTTDPGSEDFLTRRAPLPKTRVGTSIELSRSLSFPANKAQL